MNKLIAGGGLLAAALASGCSSLGTLFGPDAVVDVREAGRSMDCRAPSADMSVQLFASADAVRSWQQASGVELLGNQAMLPARYALIQLGQRASGGWGLLIGPEAEVEGRVLRLHMTLFEPSADEAVAAVPSSPCVLLRLPDEDWRGVEVYDQAGKRRARTTTAS